MTRPIQALDLKIIALANKWFMPVARVALFVIFFYFGMLKIFGLSPATPLAVALTDRTVGLQYFDTLFMILAVLECVIGLLFLVPQATRVVIPLLFIHLAVVCSPLLLVPAQIWVHPFVPDLEGQYIIKNIALVAIAIGIAANVTPLQKSAKR